MLAGRNVVLGVCGSIAAVRCVELVHELRRHGAAVRIVVSSAATSIIHPWSLEFASDRPVVTEISGSVEHIELCGEDGWGDILLIAPLTANTLGKMAAAIDDTPVTTCATTAIGNGMPVVVAPAMHEPMWDHPGILSAIETVESWGIDFVAPRLEEGKAKIADDEAILTAVARHTGEHDLDGRHIVITSGPTQEPIDPVRVISNRSSGRMGRAIAKTCHIRGADVTLIHDGPDVPYGNVKRVETAADMRETALDAAGSADALISAAAIGDFTVPTAETKLDSNHEHELHLEPAPKLLDTVKKANPEIHIVGFKAEHDVDDVDLIEAAQRQQDRVRSAFVVANDASVMGESDTRAIIVDRDDTQTITGSKIELAGVIADRLAAVLDTGNR